MIRRLFAALLLVFALAPSLARAAHVDVALVAETDRPKPGTPLTLAIVMKPAAGWHDYWSNPGDTGVATRATWTLPRGLGPAGPLLYPVPQTLLIAGLMNHVYEGPHALLVSVPVDRGIEPGKRLPIRLALDWLACSASLCVPERATLSLDLAAGDGVVTPDRRASFDRYRAALPRPLAAPATMMAANGELRVGIPYPATASIAGAHLFLATDGVIDYAAPQRIGRAGDTLVIEAKRPPGAASLPSRAEALLALGDGTGLSLSAAPGPVPALTGGAGLEQAGQPRAILLALGGALLGGLILNVMPCVFPILSLKALGLARSGGGERAARGEALAYTGGAVLTCLALGGVLLAIRAGGSAAGWAFQLTDPRAILALLVLVTAIALNLAGLFELPVLSAGGRLAGQGGAAGAFWTGALAAFVATPCAGPFMAGALGAALVLSAPAALAVFAGLGLGLALPFLLIGFVPALRRRLPKPGGWMNTFRHILAVPMLLTALGLAWVLGREAGVNGMALGLAAALVAALGLWWTGARQRDGREASWWPAALGLILAGASAALVTDASAAASVSAGHEPFSETRLATLRGERRPVFVYFTADWCLTCKVNEAAAIDRAEVQDAFSRGKVEVLEGDWTRGDPAIGRFLAAHGRSGVPFYLFYPATGEPRELPQVLTPALLKGLAG